MPKCPVHEHHASYAAIKDKSTHGLVCLKALFTEYDSSTPNRSNLQKLLAPDFIDNENESTRNIGREEAIDAIIGSRRRAVRHQMDLKRAICIEHEGKSARHEVFFEGVRHMQFPDAVGDVETLEEKGEWIRIPFAGRIEVRVKENRFQFKDPVIEIIARKWTCDNSPLQRKDWLTRSASRVNLTSSSTANFGAISPISQPDTGLDTGLGDRMERQDTGGRQIGIGGLTELPAAISSLGSDNGKPPSYTAGVHRNNTVSTGVSSEMSS